MISFYICDDEKLITDKISGYITEYFKLKPAEYQMEVFNSGKALYKAIMKKQPDVLLLDIELGDSHGIKVAKAIRKIYKTVKIIFITSYKNYKNEAFSVRAFGYIEKPVTWEQIFHQLSDIQKYISEEKKSISLKFDTDNGAINIEVKDILYFEKQDRKIKIVTFNNEFYMKQKISTLAEQLQIYNFYSPHVSFLVNLDYVTDIRNYTVSMIKDNEIPLSQRKSKEFHAALNDYLEEAINICKEND